MPSNNRYRLDLVEAAWAIERYFGSGVGAGEALGSSTNGAEGAFGLVAGGITLPDPRYEWEPFYGVGVIDRNFNFPIQGREVLEGSIPTINLTHDNSRLFLEQIMGLAFNANSLASRAGAVTTTAISLTDASATFETGTYKNNSWTGGLAGVTVLEQLNNASVAAAADETDAHDDTASEFSISFDSADDRLYVGAATPFIQVRVDIGSTVNDVACTLVAEFSDGDGNFVSGGVVSDGTSDGTDSFKQDGIIVLAPPPNWGRDVYGADSDNFYWVRFNFGAVTITAGTDIVDIDVYTSHPTHIIVVHEAGAGGTVDRWKDTFAYIGPAKGTTVAAGDTDTDGETLINVFADYGLTKPGWHGKAPLTAESGGNTNYNIYRIERVIGGGILPDITGGSTPTVDIRETLVQPSFTLAARYTAEDGGRFTTNYTGNKITRATFSFEENRPVTFSVDFIGQDMKHNLGSNTTVLKYSDDVVNPTFRRVNEQPYFFSRAELRFAGTAFARFRRLSLSIDNQLDPRYYVTQSQTVDNRQILYEILEGRRQITLSGTVDLDDNVADAQFLRWLLNQGFTDTDVRDMTTLQGITLAIELERLIDGSGPSFDRMTFTLPSGTLGGNNVGLIFRAAPHPIEAPPQTHQSAELDGFASSLQIEISDSIS
jgi:hypothetical protein